MIDFFNDIASGACPTIDDCVEVLSSHFDLLTQFRNTPQDPEWHAEGDVHIHTGMVLSEAYELLRGPAEHLAPDRRLLFVLGALLHDIAKPICTREQEVRGVLRTVARGHEAQGRSYLAPRLLELGLRYDLLESLLGLVGYHHEPKFLVVKERPVGAYKRVCRLADPELLFWVEQADMRGRTCRDRDLAIEQIDMYRMFAEDYGAFCRGGEHAGEWRDRLTDSMEAYPSAAKDLVLATAQRDLETGQIQSVEEAVARSFGHRDTFGELVVLVGPSGSGKSSFVKKWLEGYDVVSLDDLREELSSGRSDQSSNNRVLAEARERLKASLRKKRPVVWDATSLRKDFRSRCAKFGFDYGALVTLIVFHCPTDVYERRNRDRSDAVEPSVLRGQLDRMEWPELDEAHRVLYLDEKHEVLAAFGFCDDAPFGLRQSPSAAGK